MLRPTKQESAASQPPPLVEEPAVRAPTEPREQQEQSYIVLGAPPAPCCAWYSIANYH